MRAIVFLLLITLLQPALAQRPKIGLALAGGGAKGSAHIAVLKALEENNIAVDYIAGTSIGAYVGGLYALGYSADEIQTIMFEADFNRGYSDAIAREDLTFRRKQQKDRFNIPFELGFRDGRLQVSSGLLQGQTMSELYRGSVGAIPNLDDFDELPIPFRAVATDLVTSNAVILDRGDLIRVMQASATVPGALTPTEIDDRLLVDGGLSNNLPVTLVREMGADIVIAVDISSTLLGREDLQNSVSVLRQITAFLTNRSVVDERTRLDAADIYIRPEINQLSTTDFSVLPRAFEAGTAAAELQSEALSQLSLSDEEYASYLANKVALAEELRASALADVESIRLVNDSSISDTYILETLGLESGEPISNEQLIAGLEQVYTLGYFERVNAEFLDDANGRSLFVEVREKSWGPNYIDMGLGWEDDFSLNSILNADVALTMGDLTRNGGQVRTELGLGTDKEFSTEFYQPLDQRRRYYSTNKYSFLRSSRDAFIENQRAVTLDVSAHQLDLGVGANFLRTGIVESGIRFLDGNISNEVFLDDDINYAARGFYLKVGYDTLNTISFPTRGNRFTLEFTDLREDVDNLNFDGSAPSLGKYDSQQVDASWKGVLSFRNHSLVGKALFTTMSSDIDTSINLAQLGGFLNLSGYHKGALVGHKRLFSSVVYQYSMNRNLFGLNNFPLRFGVSLETGNVWQADQTIDTDDLILAGSVYVATETTLGPIALGIGSAEGNASAVYFYLGKNF